MGIFRPCAKIFCYNVSISSRFSTFLWPFCPFSRFLGALLPGRAECSGTSKVVCLDPPLTSRPFASNRMHPCLRHRYRRNLQFHDEIRATHPYHDTDITKVCQATFRVIMWTVRPLLISLVASVTVRLQKVLSWHIRSSLRLRYFGAQESHEPCCPHACTDEENAGRTSV